MLTIYVVSYKDQRKDFLKERKDKISWGYILEIEFHIISSEIDSYLAVLRIRTIQTQVIQSGGTIGQQNAVQREAFQSRGRQTFVRRHKTVRALAQFSNLNFGFLVISNLKFERVHIDLVKVQWQIIKKIAIDEVRNIYLYFIFTSLVSLSVLRQAWRTLVFGFLVLLCASKKLLGSVRIRTPLQLKLRSNQPVLEMAPIYKIR